MDSFKNLASVAEEEDDDDEEDDEDYVPSQEDLENDGDAEKDDDDDSNGSDGDSGESDDDEDGSKKSKNKRRGRKRKASVSKGDTENVSGGDGRKDLTTDEKKKKADDLWAELNSTSSVKSEPKPLSVIKDSSEVKVVEKVYDFAGEKVVIKETPKSVISSSSSSSSTIGHTSNPSVPSIPTIRRSGLQDLVSNLGKKNKLGTLQKSKIDWDSFKRDQGIEDELKQATLSKDGYVERQAFLSRADVRQFEIEKSIRSKIRKPQ